MPLVTKLSPSATETESMETTSTLALQGTGVRMDSPHVSGVDADDSLDDSIADAAAAAARMFLARLKENKGRQCDLAPRRRPFRPNSVGSGEKRSTYSRVRFDLDAITIHEVVPYSEVYGLHPREFVFEKNFYMTPSGGTFGFASLHESAQDDDASESDDSDSDIDWLNADNDGYFDEPGVTTCGTYTSCSVRDDELVGCHLHRV
jgi:hypothetical protein